MTTNPYRERYERLLVWMGDHDITFQATGEQLGVDGATVRFACQGATCPMSHHMKLLELGFPSELLPEALDKPRGRPRKVPKFPGFVQHTSHV